MYKKIFAGVLAFALTLVVASGADAAYMHTTTLKVGSKGAQVMALQQALNMTSCKVGSGLATGNFGSLTKAAVQCFQAQNGLTTDGIVGPMTGLKMGAIVSGPAGNNNQPGCPAGAMFNSMTGAPCNGGTSTPSTGNLSGGAGDVTISTTSTDVEDTVKEGEDNVKILGFKVEADGSDIAITSVKISVKNTNSSNSSENLDRYLDSVAIYMDDTKVGSADADSFSKDSGSPDEFSKTISLSNAIVREDDDAKFYVAVSAASTVDTDDQDATWDIQVDTIRFTDATGAILTADVTDLEYGDNDAFGFEDQSTDDQIDLKSSSSNPDDATVKVDENDNSDETLALAFKLDVDEDSSDVMITSLAIDLAVSNGGTDADSIENIIDTLTVKVGSKSWEADVDTDSVTDGTGSATYSVDFDDDEFTIDSGDVTDVKVYITFNDQDGNYATNGTVVTASVSKADIDAETADDELTVDGSTTIDGADLTLDTASATISGEKWTVNSTGTIADFFFTVEADDDDFDVLAADIVDEEDSGATAAVSNTAGTPETAAYGVLSRYSGDDVTAIGSTGFTVASGDSVTFRVRYSITGTNGQWTEVTVDSVSGHDVSNDKETSPTITYNVSS